MRNCLETVKKLSGIRKLVLFGLLLVGYSPPGKPTVWDANDINHAASIYVRTYVRTFARTFVTAFRHCMSGPRTYVRTYVRTYLLLTYVRTYLDGGGRSLPSPLLGHALQNNWDKPARSGHALHIVWNKPAFVWTRPLACLGQVQSGDRPCNILGTSPLLGTAGKRPVRLVAIAPAQLVQGYVRKYVRTYV